ncbi:nuclease-related domain-containing protein [Planococcus sp. CAU13]|uniref:nuclease-related domain-containing protein n=1 Tax=Planococcus sp. CAU13 TaxID=1541197 RepID=UPI00052FDE39|nr:nuclease-related domain-containing protein [Planococcus sp. CAU13]
MTILLKKETTLGTQGKAITYELKKLREKVGEIQAQNRPTAYKRAIIWTLLLGLPLFFLFPFFHLIVWFFIYNRNLKKGTIEYKKMIKSKMQELEPIRKGFNGETQVTNILVNGLSDQYVVLNDISIETNKGSFTQIDHLLVCPDRKILCIETKNIKGKFYPHKNGWLWYPTDNYVNTGNKQHVINSPQQQSIYHARQLEYNLKKIGTKLEVEPIVVLTSPEVQWQGNQTPCPVINAEQLLTYVKSKGQETNFNSKEMKRIGEVILSLDKTELIKGSSIINV